MTPVNADIDAAIALSFFRNSTDGVIAFSANGPIVSFSPGAERLFLRSSADIIGQSVESLFNESGLLAVAVHGSDGSMREAEGKRAGVGFPAELRFSRFNAGTAALHVLIVKDLTALKQAQAALKSSRDSIQRHSAAIAHLVRMNPSARGNFEAAAAEIARVAVDTLQSWACTVWQYVGVARRLQLVAESTQSHRPLSPGAIINLADAPAMLSMLEHERVLAAHDTQSDSRIQAIWAGYLSPRRVQSLLVATVRTADGAWGMIFVEHTLGPRTWMPEEQQFAGSMADLVALAGEDADRRRVEALVRRINRDLEERVTQRTQELDASNIELRQTLDTLKDTQGQLVQSKKLAALGELVAGVAHEINTPVGVALTAASHLEQQTRQIVNDMQSGALKKSGLEKYVGQAEEAAQMLLSNLTRASELVQSFKKVAVDQSSGSRRKFRVKQYVQEILVSLRPKLKRTQHEIVVEGPDDIEVNTDAGAFAQIITNLIVNALLHAFENQDRGVIGIYFHRHNGDVVLRFEDNGKGIDAQNLPRIFDPFFTTKRGQGGSGLGLHVVFNLVTATLRGNITCESTIGEGTRFNISFPVKPVPEEVA